MASDASTPSPHHPQLQRTTQPPLGFPMLHYIGFKFDSVTSNEVSGHFTVSQQSCQPYGVLHGGVSAFIAETLASFGAGIASDWKRVAGVELSINHLHAVPVGQEVIARATPLSVGSRIQVWDVKFSSVKPKDTTEDTSPAELFAVARLTLIVGLPSEGFAFTTESFLQYSKL